MSRWIDADVLITRWNNMSVRGRTEFDQEIMVAPSIDIVRCRECKHREEYPCKVYHDDDWFCADGEREGE